jgi:sugar lactone lactonase YvrE
MERILELGADIAEGPVWDAATSTWLFVDITAGLVHRLEPMSGELRSFSVGQPVSAVLPTSCGRLLLVSVHGLLLCEADGSGQTPFGHRLETESELLLNDAKVDSRGRLWTGSRDRARMSRGHLFRIDADGSATVMLEGINVSNGLGWSLDDRSFYFIDSLTYAVRIFDFDAESGSIGNDREFCSFDPDSGLPDGLSVDEHGGVWIAHFGSGTVTRHDPSGQLVAEHHFPAPNVTSLAFGGPVGIDVLVTTGKYKMTDAELAHCPTAGDIFGGTWGVRGVPTTPFIVH